MSGATRGDASLMDRFLEDSRATGRQVSLYLVSGYQLKGQVVEFDAETILFNHRDVHQLVMRSAVATVYPVSDAKAHAAGWWRAYTSEDHSEP